MIKNRAVFLDRDGVLNRAVLREGKPCPPSSSSELEILPGVREALCRLRDAGFPLIVVTNQPDVARGSQSREAVEAINSEIMTRLPIDEVRVCYHDNVDRCQCRKPLPGLLLDAARAWRLDLASSYIVGDRWRDIEAGEGAGTITIFIDHHYQEPQPQRFHAKVASLAEAADWILQYERRKNED
ncbi:MAG TPA: HAD family hydrolase [Nitrospirota bacterium]|nr:HAD family hydrolase [Nitrospirota bacterium]